MNTKLRFGLGIAVLLFGFGLYLFLETGKIRQGRRNVSITIQSPRKTYFKLEPIPVVVSITNQSSETIDGLSHWTQGYYPYTVQAYDDGKKLPMTSYGRRLDDIAKAPRISFGGSGPINDEILPGRTRKETVYINELVELRETTPRKDMLVTIKRYGVTSDAIAVRILPYFYDLKDRDIAEAVRTGKFQGTPLEEW